MFGSSPKVDAGLKLRWAGTMLKAETELCVGAAEEATLRLCADDATLRL